MSNQSSAPDQVRTVTGAARGVGFVTTEIMFQLELKVLTQVYWARFSKRIRFLYFFSQRYSSTRHVSFFLLPPCIERLNSRAHRITWVVSLQHQEKILRSSLGDHAWPRSNWSCWELVFLQIDAIYFVGRCVFVRSNWSIFLWHYRNKSIQELNVNDW